MPRLAFKPDSSFFRKIAIGAVGARAVCSDLTRYGHRAVELERGSTDTKLWKDVKRKRVRIPDLVCLGCGVRVESRAKTQSELSMSHSPAEEARAWDFGMVDSDYIAFPVCEPAAEQFWSAGHLHADRSYWHERNWVRWQAKPHVNYFLVSAFRATAHTKSSTKGVTEGSETAISWPATFSTRSGTVEGAGEQRVTVRRQSDGHRYTWRVGDLPIHVAAGEGVDENQLLASPVSPVPSRELGCRNDLSREQIEHLLQSRERTLRFTGVKLARLLGRREFCADVEQLIRDQEEDVYIRLEGASYLAGVCDRSAAELFAPFISSADPQTQLEAVIAVGETGTDAAVALLSGILDSPDRAFFLRSAAAWGLSRIGRPEALNRLIHAFSDVDLTIREEALDGIVSLGGPAIPGLLAGLRESNLDIAAGCAESLRRQGGLAEEAVTGLLEELRTADPSRWAVWLAGHLPRELIASRIAEIQESAPQTHFALSVLWAFVDSWISRRWELGLQMEDLGK
jgi:hypothetical protein